jgi:hypothetical protein
MTDNLPVTEMTPEKSLEIIDGKSNQADRLRADALLREAYLLAGRLDKLDDDASPSEHPAEMSDIVFALAHGCSRKQYVEGVKASLDPETKGLFKAIIGMEFAQMMAELEDIMSWLNDVKADLNDIDVDKDVAPDSSCDLDAEGCSQFGDHPSDYASEGFDEVDLFIADQADNAATEARPDIYITYDSPSERLGYIRKIAELTAKNAALEERLRNAEGFDAREQKRQEQLKIFAGIFSKDTLNAISDYYAGQHTSRQTKDLYKRIAIRLNELMALSKSEGSFAKAGFEDNEPDLIAQGMFQQVCYALFPEEEPAVSMSDRLGLRARELKFLEHSLRELGYNITSMLHDGIKLAEHERRGNNAGVPAAILAALLYYKSATEELAAKVPDLGLDVSIEPVRKGLQEMGKKGCLSDLIGMMPSDLRRMHGVGPATLAKVEKELGSYGIALDPLKSWRKNISEAEGVKREQVFTSLKNEVWNELGIPRSTAGRDMLSAVLTVIEREVYSQGREGSWTTRR